MNDCYVTTVQFCMRIKKSIAFESRSQNRLRRKDGIRKA